MPDGPRSLPPAAPWELDLPAFVQRDAIHWLGAPLHYGPGSLLPEPRRWRLSGLWSFSMLHGLSPFCPSGLRVQRDIKKNDTSPSQDFPPSLKSEDSPLSIRLSDTPPPSRLERGSRGEPVLAVQGWRRNCTSSSLQGQEYQRLSVNEGVPCLRAPTQLYSDVTFSHVNC